MKALPDLSIFSNMIYTASMTIVATYLRLQPFYILRIIHNMHAAVKVGTQCCNIINRI